ncbi:MAG: hypothetical protein HY331_18300 [Chloroflexi bacterium]|nr:hypothetical protein [Chloroflexota bacterium]
MARRALTASGKTAAARGGLPLTAWLGLAVLLAAEWLLVLRVQPVTTFFTPIVWTAYILFADGLAFRLAGRSLIAEQRWFVLVIGLWSAAAWLVFEAYNLHLQNWRYVGVPEDLALQAIGYTWAFATIFPGIFVTADLLGALGVFARARSRPIALSSRQLSGIAAGGAVMLAIPLLLPSAVSAYLFGLVWLGFIFLLEPITHRLGGTTVLGDLMAGSPVRLYRLLLAGLIAGLLWEFWNYWATGKWVYAVPAPLDFGPKLFEMPLLGFLGFPPFAVECFAFQSALMALLRRRWR